jgi:4-diphosphocytidyl-2-C-methyl-D-erythritol kinase
MTAPLIESAPAKVNLTLRVLARRDDGFHEIESLVVFAQLADRLSFEAGRPLGMDVRGSNGKATGPVADNLVLKAARALAAQVPGLRVGHFNLLKRIPVAAGLGGGSADAAAALRLLACLNGFALNDPRLLVAARASGADVPVCLDPRARVMRGIGELLSNPIQLPKLAAVLVNPGVLVPTKDVFMALDRRPKAQAPREGAGPLSLETRPAAGITAVLTELAGDRNDLEAPAISVAPVIAKVLAALRASPGCRLARMSGSGATCFALCESERAAAAVARALRIAHPSWWVRATTFNKM